MGKIIENERGMRVRDFSFPRKIHTTLNAAGEVGGGRSDPPPPFMGSFAPERLSLTGSTQALWAEKIST